MIGVPEVDGWYLIRFASDGKGGPFEFELAVARPGKYTGTGDEIGFGGKPGAEQLAALGRGIAAGLAEASGPYWDNITVLQVEAVPVGMITLVEREEGSRPTG